MRPREVGTRHKNFALHCATATVQRDDGLPAEQMSRPLRRDALRIIQDIVREAMGRPLPPEARTRLEKVLESLAKGDVSEAAGQGFSPREVTILFADLRGFSAISAAYPGEVVVKLLNRCFATMVDIAARHYGTVDKFIGDAIMVI